MKGKTKIKRIRVCDTCYCESMVHADCVCAYDKYKIIELDFEVCVCCGNLVNEGTPADTDWNKKQLGT